MSSILIPNGRFTENQYTKIKCGAGLRELILRNWSESDLLKFDDITYNHGFNASNELMVDSIFNNIETMNKFQDRLYKRKIFLEIDADYKLMKKYYKNLDKNETFHRVRKMRRQLYDELTSG
jgi:hypothetical protein